jgi:hypothetical protein
VIETVGALCAAVNLHRLRGPRAPRARAVRVGDRLRWFIAIRHLRGTLARKLGPYS